MKEKLERKLIGFYFAVLAGAVAIVSVVRFMLWAPKHSAMDMLIIVALFVGIILDFLLFFKDNDLVVIITTACYSIAVVKLLTDSVGSFVDAFQGIKMFGDATQVSTILSIATVMAVSVILSIIASFMKREKE
ncbi:MAG: hypothetical protein ACI4TF_00825 [Oliverpabstia sp.]